MSPPWEKYAAAPTAGPWTKYAAAPAAADDGAAGGVQDWEPRQYTTGEKVARKVGLAAQGVTDTLVNAGTAVGDASGWLARKAGLVSEDTPPISTAYRQAVDDLASVPRRVGDAVSQGSLDPIFAPRDAYQTRIEPVTTGERTAYGVGEGVGNALSVVVPAGMVANSARAGTATQGVANVLASQPVMQATMGAVGGGVTGATDNPLAGIAASLAVPVGASVARRAVTPFPNRLAPQEARLAAAAEREGIPLTPAQETGSPGLRAVEDTMAKIPGSSGPMKRVIDEQRQQFNRASLERAGVTATDASPEVIERAFVNAGHTFDDLASRTVINADQKLAQDVDLVANKYGRRLDTNVAPIFKSYMDDLEPLLQSIRSGNNNPQIAGDVYATIRSDIGKTIRANGRNADLQRALGGLQEALDSAVERSASGPLRQEWADARREYQALMTIDKAMQGGTQADRSAGNIPFSSLKSAVAQGDRAGYSRGRGQLNELSRVGDFIAQRTPDSGTPTRNAISNPLMWPVMAGANVGARAYNIPTVQSYLTNQLAPGRTNFNALYAGEAARRVEEEATGGRNALRQRPDRR